MTVPKSNKPAAPDPVAELRNAPDRPLKVPQDSKAVEEEVRQFMEASESEVSPTGSERAEARSKDRVELEPDPQIMQQNPADAMFTSGLIMADDIKISDLERDTFLKALLADEPWTSEVSLFDGKFKLLMRARSAFEQRRILDVLNHDKDQKLFEVQDFAMLITRLHYYSAAIMIQRINDAPFCDFKMDPASDLETHAGQLRKFTEAKLETCSMPRWTAILNALRIFETKSAKLSSEAANEDFWKPRDTGT